MNAKQEGHSPVRPTTDLIRAMMPIPLESTSLPEDLIDRVFAQGSGLFGETDPIKNREASGMLNHTLKTGRFGGFIARKINELGIEGTTVNVGVIENGHLVSHTGRLIWDYADKDTKEVLVKQFGTNEHVGIEQLRRLGVPSDVFLMVQALGHGGEIPPEVTEFKKTLEFRIAIYADHRTDQSILPLDERMADFLGRNFLIDKSEKNKETTLGYVKTLIQRAKESPNITGEDAARFFGLDGLYSPEARGNTFAGLLQLIIDDARTEKDLEDLGLHPEDWVEFEAPLTVHEVKKHLPNLLPDTFRYNPTDQESVMLWHEKTKNLVAPRRWERYVRRLAIQSTEGVLFDRLYSAKTGDVMLLLHPDTSIYAELGTNPSRAWWDTSVKELYRDSAGKKKPEQIEPHKTLRALLPRNMNGADRALSFFSYLGMNKKERGNRRRRIKLILHNKQKNT